MYLMIHFTAHAAAISCTLPILIERACYHDGMGDCHIPSEQGKSFCSTAPLARIIGDADGG